MFLFCFLDLILVMWKQTSPFNGLGMVRDCFIQNNKPASSTESKNAVDYQLTIIETGKVSWLNDRNRGIGQLGTNSFDVGSCWDDSCKELGAPVTGGWF